MEFIHSLFSFIIAIGILVTVHEFGHFWVARKLGVKVLRFSIGFGKPLLSKRGADGTEYVIAAVPLGGYVRMLGEQDDDINDDNRHLAFSQKSLAVKAAIVVAGPMLNFIFAIFAFWLIFTAGIPGQIAMLGDIEANSIAARSGMQRDEQIIRVNESATPSWAAVNSALLEAVLADNSLRLITRTESGAQKFYDLHFTDRARLLDDKGVVTNLGLAPWRPPVWIGEVVKDSVADKAGIMKGDRVVKTQGDDIRHWRQWVGYISQRAGQPTTIVVDRSGVFKTLEVVPEAVNVDGKVIGRIGVRGMIPDEVRQQHFAEISHGPLDAIPQSIIKTWDMSVLMLKMLGRMVIGEASHKNISGPITIAQYASLTIELGWLEFVRLLALLSISLGVLNLLPIPMLDGGHLLYYVIEFVRRKPLSEAAMMTGQQIGIVFLFLLMGLAFYNDFSRLFG